MIEIDPFILGDNAFFGVNHHSRRTGDERARRFEDPEAVADVCSIARRHGAGGLMLSSHERAGAILEAIGRRPSLRDLRLYPNVPYIMKYVQMSTRSGSTGLIKGILSAGRWDRQFASLAAGAIAYLRRDFRAMIRTAVDLEMAPYRGRPLGAIFLHNGLVDLALGMGWWEILATWDELVRKRFRAVPGYGTLNLPRLAEGLARAGLREPLIMAPFNPAGFHMNPSREACEASVRAGGYTLLAMNVLVSGAAAPEDAFRYLGGFQAIRHVVIGATSESHIAENAALLERFLHD